MARTARRQLEGRHLLFGEYLRSFTTLNVQIEDKLNIYFILFILFYLPHNNLKKEKKREKKKWRRDLTKTIGAYERLGLLGRWARAV